MAEWRIYASLNWVIIGSDNGLSPVRRQAIIWTNAGILLIGPLGTNFSEILIGIQTFSFKKLHLKTSSAKWRLFCLGLNELTCIYIMALYVINNNGVPVHYRKPGFMWLSNLPQQNMTTHPVTGLWFICKNDHNEMIISDIQSFVLCQLRENAVLSHQEYKLAQWLIKTYRYLEIIYCAILNQYRNAIWAYQLIWNKHRFQKRDRICYHRELQFSCTEL